MQYTSDDGGADYAAQHPAEEYAPVIIEEARYIHKDKFTKSAHAHTLHCQSSTYFALVY